MLIVLLLLWLLKLDFSDDMGENIKYLLIGIVTILLSNFLYLILNNSIFILVPLLKHPLILLVLIIPIIEELSKDTVLYYKLKSNIYDIRQSWIRAIFLGIGYDFAETTYYTYQFFVTDGLSYSLVVLIQRNAIIMIGHPLYTGIVGTGYYLFRLTHDSRYMICIIRALGLHILWNFIAAGISIWPNNIILQLILTCIIIGIGTVLLIRQNHNVNEMFYRIAVLGPVLN